MKKTIRKGSYNKSEVAIRKSASKSSRGPATKSMSVSLTSMKKQYLKDNSACKVTFRLPKEAAPDAHKVSVVGDFNNWNPAGVQMTRLKNGDFKATVELPRNREYRFRYLIDSSRWENDWCADKYLPNEFGSDDSVVVV